MNNMEELKSNYEKDGFLIVPDAKIDKEALGNINVSLSAILENARSGFPYLSFSNYKDDCQLQRVTQIHMIEEILKLIIESNIGLIASRITSSKTIRIWGSQLYIKPTMSNESANVGIHSEFGEMPFFSKGVLTAWLPLNDVNKKNGTLKYIRSSHLWDRKINCTASNKNVISQKLEVFSDSNIPINEVDVKLNLGGVSFHHNKLLHYSDKNTDYETRIAIAIGLITDDSILDENFNDYGYLKIINNLKYCPIIYDDKKGEYAKNN